MKRYELLNPDGYQEHDTGFFVKYSDYASLEAAYRSAKLERKKFKAEFREAKKELEALLATTEAPTTLREHLTTMLQDKELVRRDIGELSDIDILCLLKVALPDDDKEIAMIQQVTYLGKSAGDDQ